MDLKENLEMVLDEWDYYIMLQEAFENKYFALKADGLTDKEAYRIMENKLHDIR